MTAPSSERAPGRRAGLGRFARFCAVGGIGFVVDASLLLMLLPHWGPVPARLLSFSTAVFATFNLNRRWSFSADAGGSTAYWRDFAAYLGVQGFGFLCNLSIYTTSLALLPGPMGSPLVCLAIASGAALIVNFLGADLIVFRRRRS